VNPALWLVRLASLLLPPSLRRDWRREWEAEIRWGARTMQERGCEPRTICVQLFRFARGAFQDAASHGRGNWNREGESARFCLVSVTCVILVIVLVSGFIPRTRAVFSPLPYRDAARVAIVSQAGTIATRVGIRTGWVSLWRGQSRLADEIATYSWTRTSHDSARSARVSDNFFSLLGAKSNTGRQIEQSSLAGCGDCAILSYDFWRRGSRSANIDVAGHRYHVAAVLDRNFRFLSSGIGVWIVDSDPLPANKRTGVVARLRPDVTATALSREFESILRANGEMQWESMVDVSPVASSVHAVLGSFFFAVAIAAIVVAASLRLRLPRFRRRPRLRSGLFFAAKTLLLLITVLLAGIEFTPAASLTMTGGADLSTEPLSTWLFLMASMGALWWSITDQRRRCRVCLRRLGLAAHVGCPGCLLLDWAGTELVCMEGHGMLHVADLAACWSEPEQWTSLDDSWQGLFQKRA
jgi:hypothetical protein